MVSNAAIILAILLVSLFCDRNSGSPVAAKDDAAFDFDFT